MNLLNTICSVLFLIILTGCSKLNTDVRIAVVDIWQNTSHEILGELGYTSIDIVQPPITEIMLNNYDILYLPYGWAQYGGEKYKDIEESSLAIQSFIKQGGGLFVEQPNPWKNGKSQSVTPKILPYPITFHYEFNDSDYSVRFMSQSHPITKDLNQEQMPEPSDSLSNISKSYQILVRGSEDNPGKRIW